MTRSQQLRLPCPGRPISVSVREPSCGAIRGPRPGEAARSGLTSDLASANSAAAGHLACGAPSCTHGSAADRQDPPGAARSAWSPSDAATCVPGAAAERLPAPPTPSYSELAPLLESLQESLQELHARRQQSLAELQELAVELAVAVAAHVTRGAIDRQEHGVEPLVREALDRLGASGPVRVSLHPLDLPRLQAAWQRPGDGPPAMVECVADPGTPRGTCRVTEGVRAVAFDWRTHLDDLRALLLEELEHAQTERRGSQAADQRIKRFPDRRETA